MCGVQVIDMIIPTWNNRGQLEPCLESLYANTQTVYAFHVWLVNNGERGSVNFANKYDRLTILEPGVNLGWEGGLRLALAESSSSLVLFCNDDVFFLKSNANWLDVMADHFTDSRVGAVGPTSNVVMGSQNIFYHPVATVFSVPFLIFFNVLLRRAAVDEAGGIDTQLPGGDDLDLSIRLRNLGYTLLVDRSSFVYHHGFGSGPRMHGVYYNSVQMGEATDHALISKHGLASWWEVRKQHPVNEYVVPS